MSETYLRLIPHDPAYMPDEDARSAALAYFSAILPEVAEVSELVTPNIEFIDQGGNFEYVACPMCYAVIEHSWWTRAMDQAYDHELGFV
jgi:hypothetical protein